MNRHDIARPTAGTTLAGFLLALATVPAALAQTTTWDAGTGDWFNGDNWTDGVPDDATSAVISNGGTAQIAGGAEAVGVDVGRNGTGVLEVSNLSTVDSDSCVLGAASSDSSGEVTIEGTGTSWTMASLTVGDQGLGEFRIQNGASVDSVFGTVGNLNGSAGLMSVDGAETTWTNDAGVEVGNFGQAELIIDDGATATAGEVVIGDDQTANGEALVFDAGSEWLVDGPIRVGNEGQGLLAVDVGALVDAAGEIRIGNPAGAGGQVLVGGELLAGGGIVVEGAGTLGGGGQFGDVTVEGTGTLEPSLSIGPVRADGNEMLRGDLLDVMDTADVVLGTDATTVFRIGGETPDGAPNDRIEIDGDLTLDGFIDVIALADFEPGRYVVMTYTGELLGSDAEIGEIPDGEVISIDDSVPGEIALEVQGPAPELLVDPRDVFFPDTSPGDSATASFTLENIGDAELVISQIEDPGPHYAFGPGDCGALPVSLAAGETCDMEATFTPQLGGDLTRTVEVESNAPDSPDFIFLIGNGIVQVVPTLGTWGLMLLTVGMAVFGLRATRR